MDSSKKNLCKKETYAAVYLEQAKAVRGFIYFKCGQMDLAEDLVQDAFIKLWDNCKKVDISNVKNYLFTIANNLFLNKIKHQSVIYKHQNSHKVLNYAETPEFLLIEKEFQKKLDQAINSLTEKQREVFLLSRIEKKKYKEIAITLGISIKTVEKHMHNALLALRQTIGDI